MRIKPFACISPVKLGKILIALSILWFDVPAAQSPRNLDTDRRATVMNRPRPDYDPTGIHAGGFLLYPEIIVRADHNDNIFATQTDTIEDEIIVFQPNLAFRSNWNRHRLNFRAAAALGRYVDVDTQDYDDYFLNLDGRVDINRDTNLSATASYARGHEERGSPDESRGVEPTVFHDTAVRAAYYQKLNRFSVNLDADLRQLEYNNVQALTPSGFETIDNSDRDRDISIGTLRIGYELVSEYEAFVRGTLNSVSYDNEPDRNSFFRNTDGYEFTVGAAVDIPGTSFGELFVGYLSQDFDDPRFESLDKTAFGGSLSWNVTQLTTLNMALSRRPRATTQAGASSTLDNRFEIRVDHELRRHLLLNLDLFFGTQEFNGIPRKDDVSGVILGSRYLLNRYLSLSLSYSFDKRDSNLEGSSFERNILRLGIELRR